MRSSTPPSKKPAVWPSVLGHGIEYFDYSLYSLLAPVLAAALLGTQDPTTGLLQIYGILAFSSIAKPIGSLIFGSIGDRFGRARALEITMIGMILPTFGLAWLPSAQTAGIWSMVGLVFFRFLQGILMGGESEGARLYILERTLPHRPCFANSLTWLSSLLGIAAASVAAAWVMWQPPEMEAWRIIYMGAGILSLSLFFVRRSFEPDTFPTKSRETISWKTLLTQYKASILFTVLVCGSVGGVYYFYLIFWPTYLFDVVQILPEARGASHLSLALWVYALTSPCAGLLADWVGARRTMIWGNAAVIACFVLNGVLVSSGSFPLWCELLTAACITVAGVPGYVLLMQRFPVQLRYRGLGIGHAIASVTLSNSAPWVSTHIWHISGVSIAPLAYGIFLAAITLGCGYALRPRPAA